MRVKVKYDRVYIGGGDAATITSKLPPKVKGGQQYGKAAQRHQGSAGSSCREKVIFRWRGGRAVEGVLKTGRDESPFVGSNPNPLCTRDGRDGLHTSLATVRSFSIANKGEFFD